MSYKGHYKIRNVEKYVGGEHAAKRATYRSMWERKFMEYCDQTNSVKKWASEPFAVTYFSPVDNHMRKYYPDFYVKIENRHGEEKEYLIEIKPYKQTLVPQPKFTKKWKNYTKRYLREATTYATNQAKWAAAKQFCKERGWKFKVLTEKEASF